MADNDRLGNLKKMDTILHKMQDSAQELINLDSEYGTYNTEELKADIDNMIYWLEQEIQHFGDYEASTKKSKTKSFNDMVKSIRYPQNSLDKSSNELAGLYSQLRDCVLDIAQYFYNSGVTNLSNKLTTISDKIYYLYEDSLTKAKNIINIDGDKYPVPESIEDKCIMAKQLIDEILLKLNVEDRGDLRHKSYILFDELLLLIKTSKED